MRSKVFFVLAFVFLVAGILFGMHSNHFVAAGFCLFAFFGSMVRTVVTLGDGDRIDDPHHQQGF
jgi:hypothetical protein